MAPGSSITLLPHMNTPAMRRPGDQDAFSIQLRKRLLAVGRIRHPNETSDVFVVACSSCYCKNPVVLLADQSRLD